MKIVNNTQEIARKHGVHTPGELAERLDIARGTAYNLWRGHSERIDFPILMKICREFGVTPGDILQVVENGQAFGVESTPKTRTLAGATG